MIGKAQEAAGFEVSDHAGSCSTLHERSKNVSNMLARG
jgi:hypothetical protein